MHTRVGATRTRSLAALVGALAFAATLLLSAAPASATTLERMTVEQMSWRASRVVVGTVTGLSFEPWHGGVRTAVHVAVQDSLKGAAGGQATVYVPGGLLPGGGVAYVSDMATFALGEQVCVFADSAGWVMGGYQGKVGIARGIATTGDTLTSLKKRVEGGVHGRLVPATPPSAPAAKGPVALDAPAIISVTPSSAPAGADATIQIWGSGFGATPGNVYFYCGAVGEATIPAIVHSWSDAVIVCDVPVSDSGYPSAAGSGPMVVTTAGGASSAPYQFQVPFAYGSYRWADPLVKFRVNDAGAPERRTLVDAAARQWSDAGADFAFEDDGPTTSTSYAVDGHNDMFWAPGLGSGIIAQAQWVMQGGRMVDCDVQFSTDYPWGDDTPGTYDVQAIAEHEMGHWLSLRDLYGPGDTAKVMYGFGETQYAKRALSAGDIAGIQWIYGQGSIEPSAPVATSISIRSSASRVTYPRPFVLSGVLAPGGLGDPCVVEVRKPGSGRWSYSSNRLAYTAAGDWWYRYTPKLRGTYSFRARFVGDADRLASLSRIIAVTVR